MRISLELDQSWETAEELRDYLELLVRTLHRICEMEADTPKDWYFEVEFAPHSVEEVTLKLTHL